MEVKWIRCEDALPETAGEYAVRRRGIGRRPCYEDVCEYDGHGGWKNRQGVVIVSVVEWHEA